MNKGLRNEIKQRKYKHRLKLIGALNDETLKNPKGDTYNYTSFKNHSKPCSCLICSYNKYNRAKDHKQFFAYLDSTIH